MDSMTRRFLITGYRGDIRSDCLARAHVRLRNGGVDALGEQGGRHANRHNSNQRIETNRARSRNSLVIGKYRQNAAAVRKKSARPVVRQEERHGNARERSLGFVLDNDCRGPVHSLVNVIDGAFALYYRDAKRWLV